jgi:Ca2+-binding RTX toxin-like protein
MANPINPADFVLVIDNPFFTLQPGTTFTTQSPDGSETITFVVTRQTKVINGVTCVVVKDTAKVDGELVEKTSDYFAQDKYGNVWYFGEDTAEYENGKVVSTEGTWRAGVDGATPGFIMLASPQVGNEYDQENAIGVAEDHAKVLSLSKTADVPYGGFDNVLQTLETSPLDAGLSEKKHYVAGVGSVLTTDGKTGEVLEELVKIDVDGTSRADKLFGYAGGDGLNGNGGNDHLDGWLGSDTVKGGSGNDLIEGGGKLRFDGGDDHAADYLYGGSGRDTILVGAADHAFGGSGNDLMQLLDNTGFAEIDGGSQNCRNVGRNAGDVLQFGGLLDLTAAGLSERISGIELGSAEAQWSDWYSSREFRDRRTAIFVDYFDGDATFQYALRVITPGDFRVAPARAELMYRPSVRTNSSNLKFTFADRK